MKTVELAYDVYETPETRPDKCPVVFVHGLFWNKYMLRNLAKKLCILTKRKVFCPDMRCHDKSPFGEEYDVATLAEDIKRFLRDRKLEKVSFVCHSAPTTVVYLVAVDEPQMVEKLVFIDHPLFPVYSEEGYKRNVLAQFDIQKRLLANLDPSMPLQEAKSKILRFRDGANSKGVKIYLQKAAYELIKVNNEFKWKTDHDFLMDGYVRNFGVQPRGRSDHDILFIRCEGSTALTDETFTEILQNNPNAKLLTIKDSTHLLMFEKEEEFLEAVKKFLS